MLNFDDEELGTILLGLEIAIQAVLSSQPLKSSPEERCCTYCSKRFAAVVERIRQYQDDQAEENAAIEETF